MVKSHYLLKNPLNIENTWSNPVSYPRVYPLNIENPIDTWGSQPVLPPSLPGGPVPHRYHWELIPGVASPAWWARANTLRPWDPVGPRGTPWDPVGPRGTPWDPVGPRGTPWDPWDPWDPWARLGMLESYPLVMKHGDGKPWRIIHLQLIFPAINLHSKWISHQSWRWDDGSHGTHLIKRKSLDSRML